MTDRTAVTLIRATQWRARQRGAKNWAELGFERIVWRLAGWGRMPHQITRWPHQAR